MICGCGNTNSSSNDVESIDSSEEEVDEIEKPSYANDFASVQKACYANDYESAHQILANLRQNAIDKAEGGEYSKTRAEYLSALETLYTSELTYIVLNYPEEAELRIMIRMNELLPLGEKPIDEYWPKNRDDIADIPKNRFRGYDNNSYMLWVKSYNAICSKLFDLAISVKNQHLAQTAVSLTKENLVFEDYPYAARHIKIKTKIEFTDTDRKSITSRYEDAVNSGLFK